MNFTTWGVPYVRASIGGLPSSGCVVDTGWMGAGTVTVLDLAELKHIGKIRGLERMVSPRFPEWVSDTGSVESFTLGRIAVPDLNVCSAEYRLLGNEFLCHFEIVFDFPGRALYLKPGRWLPQPNAIEFDGLSIERRDREYWIVNVSDGSQAASWGVQTGDELIQVDSKPVKGLIPVEVRRELRRARERGQLVVRRNGREVNVGPKQMAP